MVKQRNTVLDAIKGIAIIAVALYHFGGGILPYGYLGVDVFLVVGGYLLIRSLSKQIGNSEFHYWSFLFRKIVRLWPLVLLAVIASVSVGYFLSLPDDYENLAESAIASSAFANNVLQCITTKNYWDVVNQYKPLMHLWYVGVLMQAYVVLPIIYVAFNRIYKTDFAKKCTIILTAISFALFVLPFFSTAQKFYYLPFRIYEITTGGVLLFVKPPENKRVRTAVAGVSGIFLIILLCSRYELISGSFMVVLTVLSTVLFLWTTMDITGGAVIKGLAEIGRRSYSIYIWHQVIIAFLFYSVYQYANPVSFIVFLFITVVISILSYQFVEKPLGSIIGEKKKEAVVIVSGVFLAVIVCAFSFIVYMHAGVVRDVPELGITRENAHRHMHSEYCDRPYGWDQPFEADKHPKILVLGNSFGRDWANILYEFDSDLNISYVFYNLVSEFPSIDDRIAEADFVFFAVHGETGIPDAVREHIGPDKLSVVGNKNFGTSNGIIYAKRGTEGYYDLEVPLLSSLMDEDLSLAEEFGDHYISMIEPVKDGTSVRVFTDEKQFISQDCRHLTQAGARYYSRVIDIAGLLGLPD